MIDHDTERLSGAPVAEPSTQAETDDSVRAAFSRLYEDGRAYASAELEKQKTRASIVAGAIRTVAICTVIALILVFAAIVTLLVGLVFALAPAVGPLLATVIVVGVALAMAIVFLLVAKSAIGGMKKALTP